MSGDARDRNPTATPPATETTSGARRRFVALYGAKPWHLLSLLACFAVTGYAVSRLLGDSVALVRIVIWFVGAAVVWDLVVGPLLAAGDGVLRPVLRRLRVREVPLLNYVRFPAMLSLLLLVVFAPLILQRSEGVYRSKSGLLQDPYLDRWLLLTLGLFAAAAAAYGVAVLRARRRAGAGADPST